MADSGADKLNFKKFMKSVVLAMKEQNITVEQLFSQIDVDMDGKINGPELHKGLNNLAGEYLSPGQISILIQSMDADSDNRINMTELRSAIDRAK